MPVTSVDKDLENLTITITADFPVPVSRLWDAYVDPRQLEKFWGPPTYPATFTRHDVFPGGRSEYYMTGPEGDKSHGWWEYVTVSEGESFEVLDGFSNEDGTPNTDMPTMRMAFAFSSTEGGSRLVTTTHFNSLEQLEQLIEMGMIEGTKEAMGQIDDVLADLQSFAADRATGTQYLSDTQVRVSRVIRGTIDQVWQAHHDPDLMRRWLYGPDGWSFTDLQVAEAPGETYRYAYAPDPGVEGEPFALVGELVESEMPHREVFLENMEGIDGPPTRNEQTLTPVEGGTLLSLVITYDSKELRDMILGTGMTDGMEIGYARLESQVLAGV